MNKIKHVSGLLIAVGLLTAGCQTPAVGVQQYGEIRDVLRDGHTQPRISLAEATRVPHAFGVGALAELEGEITILDGEVWVARVSDDGLTMSGPEVVATDKATLLTLGTVSEWQSIELVETVGREQLQNTVEQLARQQGIDTSDPFPFVIEGKMLQLESHVIAGSCPRSGTGSGLPPWRISVDEPIDATLVGFYAKGQDGIMTHHGSSVHIHVVIKKDGRTITAHVDEVLVSAGSVLRLPSQNPPPRARDGRS